MNATSTHDTKRGEDVRARLNVLSEIPEEWQQQVRLWSELNRSHKTKSKYALCPDRNDEYALYQTLIGAYPWLESEQDNFVDRVKDYLLKAIREAKVHTTWLRPNESYEESCINFVKAILERSDTNSFLKEFLPFQQKIASYGVFNSLSQTLLKITSPGVPDFYQGTELWDLSLVDPDNRRPVDFEQRQQFLHDLKANLQNDVLKLIPDLFATQADGRIKLFLIVQALKARTQYQQVFQQGNYVPLEVTGSRQDHVIAFARQQGDTTLITIAPRFFTHLIQPGEYPLGSEIWQDTGLLLPSGFPATWTDTLTNQNFNSDGRLSIGAVLNHFPAALLVG